MEPIREIANGPNTFTVFTKMAPPQMFHWTPNAPPTGGAVNVKCKSTASAYNLSLQASVQGSS